MAGPLDQVLAAPDEVAGAGERKHRCGREIEPLPHSDAATDVVGEGERMCPATLFDTGGSVSMKALRSITSSTRIRA